MAKAQPRNRLGDILRKVYRHQRKLEVEWEKAVDRAGAQLAMAYAGELPTRQRRRIKKLASGRIRRGAFVPAYDDAWQFLFARRGDKPSFLNQAERNLLYQKGALTPTLWGHVVEKLATAMYRTAGRAFDQELREFCRANELSDKLAKAFKLLEEQGYPDDLLDGAWSVLSGDAATAGLSRPNLVRQDAARGTVVNQTVNVHIDPAGGLVESTEKTGSEGDGRNGDKTAAEQDTPPQIEGGSRDAMPAARDAKEAIRRLGVKCATVRQLAEVVSLTQGAIRSRIKRAIKKDRNLALFHVKILPEPGPWTAKKTYGIEPFWKHIQPDSERSQEN